MHSSIFNQVKYVWILAKNVAIYSECNVDYQLNGDIDLLGVKPYLYLLAIGFWLNIFNINMKPLQNTKKN